MIEGKGAEEKTEFNRHSFFCLIKFNCQNRINIIEDEDKERMVHVKIRKTRTIEGELFWLRDDCL